ncbi:MAG: sugar transferase [Candidatus Latescibacteria bacterium]|nr:sugar transferase [Candidatus Latescibacterota bacterium]NIM21479.1 sugar transferase [Candidatus Latescibacterota bacterium]NIM65650.1 sugar transferase [Candidatus Latescibacterota bacterium]NIO02032.1 sugar transferase [Candidatus Latescibacterota bacterium]NIO28844.1 sugar transferase [Candidatus Latescibacterota bacterium]
MTFSKPKRAPNAAGSALRAEAAFQPADIFISQPESVIYHRDFFHIPASFAWKRMLDILLSSVAMLLLAPLMLFTALLVKMTSPGPVLFSQERIGLDRRTADRRRHMSTPPSMERRRQNRRINPGFGKPFKMYKFRTMKMDAEKGGKPVLARKGDPRITPIGAIMRKSRLDELPQFVNVLRGDMSIVGPRPERAYFIEEMKKEIPNFPLRLRAKPGITGLAQVELGYANDTEGMRNKLRFDLQYIQSLSAITDLKILLKTVSVVLTGKGAC